MDKIELTAGDPSEPKKIMIIFEGKEIEAECWKVREFGGIQNYIMIREPNTRPYTKVSLEKRNLDPIKDDYDNLPNNLKRQFK